MNIYFALAEANLYAMTLNLLHSLDDAMRVNVALMDEATIDNAQLIRLLDIKLLRQAIENARVLFTALGGALPSVLNVAPIERRRTLFRSSESHSAAKRRATKRARTRTRSFR